MTLQSKIKVIYAYDPFYGLFFETLLSFLDDVCSYLAQ